MNFIGLSGHLNSGATGHYETFHEGLFLAAKKHHEFNKCVYVGSSLSEETWFLPLIPASAVSRFPWARRNLSAKLFGRINPGSNVNSLLHVYEGNLYWLYQISSLVRSQSETRGYINFFNSAKYSAISSNPFRSYFFKMMIQIAIKGVENRIVLTADTEEMAAILRKKTKFNFSAYPIYSILNPDEYADVNRDGILFLIRGKKMMDELLKGLKKVSQETLDRITVHGVPTIKQIQLCEGMGIKVSRKHLVGSEYSDFYRPFSHVVILYDPDIFANQSSGRLCDGLVAGCHLLIMKESALIDVASQFGNFSTFRIAEIDQLFKSIEAKILPEFPSKAGDLPTAARALNEIIRQDQECSATKASKRDPVQFSVVFQIIQICLFFMRVLNGAALRISGIFKRIR